MRVIAGSARSLPLKTVKGMNTRPTTDRIKETLFNMIAPRIPGARFLDLFSGSGAIGIEALSRGAESAVLVEKDRAACECIRENLRFTRLQDRARLLSTDVLTALNRLREEGAAFDIIFMDPPYDTGLDLKALQLLSDSPLITPETLIIVEASIGAEPELYETGELKLVRQKRYKTNQHLFLQKGSITSQ